MIEVKEVHSKSNGSSFSFGPRLSHGALVFSLLCALTGSANSEPLSEIDLAGCEAQSPATAILAWDSNQEEPEIKLRSTSKEANVPDPGTPEYDYQLAQKYYKGQVYNKAVKFFTSAAERGHAGGRVRR